MTDRTNYIYRVEITESWPEHVKSNSVLHDVMSMMHELKANHPHIHIEQSGALVSELIGYEAEIQEQLEVAGCGKELIDHVFKNARALYGVEPFAYGPDEDPIDYDAHPADEERRLGLTEA